MLRVKKEVERKKKTVQEGGRGRSSLFLYLALRSVVPATLAIAGKTEETEGPRRRGNNDHVCVCVCERDRQSSLGSLRDEGEEMGGVAEY